MCDFDFKHVAISLSPPIPFEDAYPSAVESIRQLLYSVENEIADDVTLERIRLAVMGILEEHGLSKIVPYTLSFIDGSLSLDLCLVKPIPLILSEKLLP